jgi:hypothetical protein
MRITDFSKPKSSKLLNENVARKFGTKLNIDSFTSEQLTSARQTLVSKLNHLQTTVAFNELTENSDYQKSRALLDVIDQALTERKLESGEEQKKEKYVKGMKKVKGDFEKKYPGRGEEVMYATATKMAKKESVEEAMAVLRGALTEQVLTEGEEEKAALIMSARDMVDDVTGWLDDTAMLKAERLLELCDSIRDELGSDISGQFQSKVKPALEEIYTVLEKNRQLLAQAVSLLTGEAAPTMGAEGAPEPAPGEDAGIPGEADITGPEEPVADAFGAAAPAAGGLEAAGRMKRESIQRNKKKV